MPNIASSQPCEKKGIDIRKALEILSVRSSESHTHLKNGDGECHHDAPTEAIEWGQRIDIGGGETTADESIEITREKLEIERSMRRVAIEEKLNKMSVKDLLDCVMNAQCQRVAGYRTYDRYVHPQMHVCNTRFDPAYICLPMPYRHIHLALLSLL